LAVLFARVEIAKPSTLLWTGTLLADQRGFPGSLFFMQGWKTPPRRGAAGTYRYPPPVDSLVSGKRVVITQNLGSTDFASEPAEIRVVRCGQLSSVLTPLR